MEKLTKSSFETRLNTIVSNTSDFIIGDTTSGSSEPTFNIGERKGRDTALFAIKLFQDKDIFIVWDLRRHREFNGARSSLTVAGKSWDKIPTGKDVFEPRYKEIGKNYSGIWEKVYIVGLSHFDKFFSNYGSYMQFNMSDETFPCYSPQARQCANTVQWFSEDERVKYSSSQYHRKKQFRDMVLAAYGHQCAICRCGVDKILQAAHERGYEVAYTKYDNPKHGICLCANHHLMYDQHLIDINLKALEITINEEKIREMPWYQEFVNKYQGKILERIDHV